MQLIASMGLGKSGALLLNAQGLSMHYGQWPGMLLFAPLQVALNWRNEAPLWLPDKRLTLVAGSEASRKAALATSADITVVTYDNLPWLHKYAPGDWATRFGRIACCDESTRIKRTRASWQTSTLGKRWLRTDGGVQNNALAEHAGDFDYWVNATGTPTPNGMVDLWGQYWFLDGGYRLGNSYTAFEQRWFMVPNRHTDFAKPVPQPGAEAQIAGLVADITVVAKVEDYYEVAKPNVVDRFVELPAKARKQYSEMKSRMATELAEGKIATVQSAGARNIKLLQMACISAGTPTLTRRGWVAIETVLPGDEVWDGVEWVRTDGAVFKGVKPTVNAYGARMTADHKVLTDEGWKPAGDVSYAHASTKFNRLKVQLPDSAFPLRSHLRRLRNLDMRLRLWGVCSEAKSATAADRNDAEERRALWVPLGGLAQDPRHDQPPGVLRTKRRYRAVPQPAEQGLRQLRRAWHNGVRPLARIVQKLLGGHGTDIPRGVDAGPSGCGQRLLPRELPLGHDGGAAEQSAEQRVSTQRSDSIASRPRSGAKTRHGLRAYAQGCNIAGSRECSAKKPVYDLLNCGPRARFVIAAGGAPLIVHNCGFAYWRDDNLDPDLQLCEELHTAKLDAIDSILEETGEPLVVVYFFQATLQMLRKKFKGRLRELDKHGKAQDDWNAGKVELLALQYSSGSMGLSLQHGGRNICLVSPTYRADDYSQVLERLGPLRQMQSGYNRVVNVFRIVTAATEDARVFDVATGKLSWEQAMIDFIQEAQNGK
jgi:hypothetical protein